MGSTVAKRAQIDFDIEETGAEDNPFVNVAISRRSTMRDSSAAGTPIRPICGAYSSTANIPAGDVGAARIRLAQIAEGKSRRPFEVGDPEKIVQDEVPNLLAGFRWVSGECQKPFPERRQELESHRKRAWRDRRSLSSVWLVELLLQPEGIG